MTATEALRAGAVRLAREGPAPVLVAVLLTAAIAVAYLPSLNASFQFDDWNIIVRDPRAQSLSAWWQSMPGIRPLTRLSYALNHAFGAGAGGMRLFNIGCHYSATLLVYALIGTVAQRAGWSATAARWSALWVALVFALHPVQTEAVTYLSGRSVSLSATFALAGLVSWQRAGTHDARSRQCLWLSLGCYLLAVSARETALVLPLALSLLAAAGWSGAGLRAHPQEKRAALWPHWLLLTALLALIALMPDYRRLLAVSFQTRSIADNLLTQAGSVQYLLGQLFWPLHLNADPWLPAVTVATPWIITRALLVACTVAIGLACLRRRPEWAFGILWCVVWLAPTNSLLARYDVVNDRQLYLALIGPAWLLCCAARGLLRGAPAWTSVAVAAVAACLAAALLLATVLRNQVYRDEIAFWTEVVARSPTNPRAANNLGYALALECRDIEAEALFSESLRLDPGYARAGVNLRLLRAGTLPRARVCH